MEKNLYSIYDKKLERYNVPGFDDDDKNIMVGLSRQLKDKSQPLYINRDDYALYCLGTFNDQTGVINALSVPRLVCDISNLTEE